MKSEMPFTPRGAGRAREHEVHDVLGDLVVARADEDLRALDRPGAVAARRGQAGDVGEREEPACGSVSTIVPEAAGKHGAEVLRLLRRRAELVHQVGRALIVRLP
jgi:hypothetical protein